MRTPFLTLLSLGAVGLAACKPQARSGPRADNRLCTPFATAQANTAAAPGLAPAAAADPAAPLDNCLHMWGYSLAASSDPADVVARATVAACGSALSRWNQATLSPPDLPPGAAPPAEALSLTTGQPISPMAAHNEFAQTRALFYVVQARAGHCAPPPANNGQPVAAS